MNEQNTNAQQSTSTNPAPIGSPHQPKKLGGKFSNLKKPKNLLLLTFITGFAVVGVILLINSFAATPSVSLYRAFRNLSTKKPTAISGEASITYKDFTSFKNAQLTFNSKVYQRGNDSSVNGALTVNGTSFPYDIRYANDQMYVKLSNTSAASKVVTASSPAYPYVSKRFDILSSVNDQWITEGTTQSNGAPSNYSCAKSTPLYLSNQDSEQLKKAFTNFRPLKIQQTKNEVVNGEKVKTLSVNLASKDKAKQFIDYVSAMELFQRINTCTNSVANVGLLDNAYKLIDATSVSMTLLVNDSEIIKGAELKISGNKADVSVNLNLSYLLPELVAKPDASKARADFFAALVNDQYNQDQAKEQDLYAINTAIEKYIVRNNTLPKDLLGLNLKLAGNIKDYEYTYKNSSYNGGPSLNYSVCTTFSASSGKPFVGTKPNEPATYTSHKKGYSCFANSYYRSASHISYPY